MNSEEDYQDKVIAYLRKQLFEEECFAHSYKMDRYSQAVYRRGRELYWTLSRVFGTLFRKARFGSPAITTGAPAYLLGFDIAEDIENSPRIFIDATDLLISGKATGIQRVLHEIARNAAELGLAVPVAASEGRFIPAVRLPNGSAEIEYSAGDILLLLDAGWNCVDRYPQALEAFRKGGGVVVACVYDLFPLIYPMLYTRRLNADFQAWIAMLLSNSDAAVAISRSTAESFEAFTKVIQRKPHEGFRLGWWRLGADLKDEETSEPSAATRRLAGSTPFFLSVGTLEMRKGYPIALEAFEHLWAEGLDANYVIVGRPGWNASAFEERLRYHPQRGRRVFWLDDADDADLRFLYKEARAVVLATFAEGFGLPLVEAVRFGTPVIASDLDVFHEIGGADVRYFDVLDPAGLATRIREAMASGKFAPKIDHLSWRESTMELMNMLRSGSYQKQIG